MRKVRKTRIAYKHQMPCTSSAPIALEEKMVSVPSVLAVVVVSAEAAPIAAVVTVGSLVAVVKVGCLVAVVTIGSLVAVVEPREVAVITVTGSKQLRLKL